MKKTILLILPMCAVCFLASDTRGQSSLPAKAVKATGKATVIVVGSAAKAGWVTTKFVTKNVAAPIAKAVLLKAVPKTTAFTLKLAGKATKKAVPAAGKLSLAYLKTRLPV